MSELWQRYQRIIRDGGLAPQKKGEQKPSSSPAIRQDAPSPRPAKEPACYSCGTTNGIWEVNQGTCWPRWVCQECQGKVTMPTAHLCDPSLPLTAPCRGGEAPSWLCPRCEAAVGIEATEEVNGRVLTFWRCPKGCTVGVTPATVRIPPVMVPRVRQ